MNTQPLRLFSLRGGGSGLVIQLDKLERLVVLLNSGDTHFEAPVLCWEASERQPVLLHSGET